MLADLPSDRGSLGGQFQMVDVPERPLITKHHEGIRKKIDRQTFASAQLNTGIA